MTISRHWSLRTTGWVAAYALALHTILSALVVLPAAGPAPGDGAVLCLSGHGSGTADPAGGAPLSGAQHCAACFMAAGALPVLPAAGMPVALSYAAPAIAAPHDTVLPSPTGGRPGLPRAPPRLA